jgi:ABC-type sugar transport system substrate-binding protein
MKNKIHLIIAALLCGSILLGGCTQAASTETSVPADTATAIPESAITATPEQGNETGVEATVQPSGQGKIVIGYEGDDINSQDLDDLQKACKELQVECIKGESMAALAGQKVSAILSFSNRWKVLGDYPKIHEMTSTTSIPLFILDAETEERGVYNLSVETDAVRTSLDWMFEQMGDSGDFVYYNFGGNEFFQSTIDATLAKHPGIKATSMPAEYSNSPISEGGITALATGDPNLGAIWSSWDYLNNIFWGLKEMKGDKVPVTLCDARLDIWQAWKERIDSGSPFKCISIVRPGGTAYEGVYVAYYVLSGEQVNPEALIGNWRNNPDEKNTFKYDYGEVTNENLAEWIDKVDSLRITQDQGIQLPPMSPEEIKAKWFK